VLRDRKKEREKQRAVAVNPRAGVYVWRFPSGCVYVGASFDLAKRVKDHRSYLRRGLGDNPKLQAEWDVCGGRCVLIERPLPIVTADELAVIERVLIREWVERVGRDRVLNQNVTPSPIRPIRPAPVLPPAAGVVG
jgi:hypothetical protein